MKYPSVVFILSLLLLHSCGANKTIVAATEEYNYSDQEIQALSKDCEYVKKQLKKGLKRWKEPKEKKISEKAKRKDYSRTMTIKHGHRWAKENKRKRKAKPKQDLKIKKQKKAEREIPFTKNDFLVSLLEHTSCLKGKTQEQIRGIFGAPYSRRGSRVTSYDFMIYHFHYEGTKYRTLSFIFEADRLLLTRKSWIEMTTISCFPLW